MGPEGPQRVTPVSRWVGSPDGSFGEGRFGGKVAVLVGSVAYLWRWSSRVLGGGCLELRGKV